MKNKQEL